jgi:hypothetical protein
MCHHLQSLVNIFFLFTACQRHEKDGRACHPVDVCMGTWARTNLTFQLAAQQVIQEMVELSQCSKKSG